MILSHPFKAAESVELDVVQKWLKNNFVTFEDTDGLMFEKYDVRRVGPGSGGEYNVQTGFGWTNGVAISLLSRHVGRAEIINQIYTELGLRRSPRLRELPLGLSWRKKGGGILAT